MKKEFHKLFRVYIFDKNFKVRNAGGFPPDYMFHGKNPIGRRYDIYGNYEDEVIKYVKENLTDEAKENFIVMAKYLEDTETKVIEV